MTTSVHKVAPYIDRQTGLRVGGSSHSLPRKSVSRPKKHTLTQQLSVLILYNVDETRIDVLLKLKFSQYSSIHTNYIITHCTTLQYNHNI